MSENFDHSEAYEKDKPMGEAISNLLNLAKEHNCPITVTAVTKRDNSVSSIAMAQHQSEERPLPPNVELGVAVMQLQPESLAIIEAILRLDAAANANSEQFMTVLAELQGAPHVQSN